MSKFSLVLILMLFAGRVSAQQDYFIFFQSDNNQPFYILRGDKTYSSSAQGHLILPQLKEGMVSFKIGWPGKRYPDEMFTVGVRADMEFQLKNLGEKGWQLFNPQTLELKAADKVEGAADAGLRKEGVKKDDAFSRMMAGVVSDTAVMYNTYAMDKVLKDVPVTPAVDVSGGVANGSALNGSAGLPVGNLAVTQVNNSVGTGAAGVKSGGNSKDSMVGQVDTASTVVRDGGTIDTIAKKSLPAAERESTKNSLVKRNVIKISEKKGTKNWQGVYTDGVGRKADTIVVIIPNDTVAKIVKAPRVRVDTVKKGGEMTMNERIGVDTSERKDVALVKAGTVEKGEVIERKAAGLEKGSMGSEKGGVAVEGEKKAAEGGEKKVVGVEKGVEGGEKKVASKVVVVNSDCKSFATDYDLDKLRVKMLEAGKDDDRIVYAKKVFKAKCFTTRQIRALSEVFVTDGQKYRFFETAYPFVSDDRFGELASLLADPVYNSKFRAMTGQ